MSTKPDDDSNLNLLDICGRLVVANNRGKMSFPIFYLGSIGKIFI